MLENGLACTFFFQTLVYFSNVYPNRVFSFVSCLTLFSPVTELLNLMGHNSLHLARNFEV